MVASDLRLPANPLEFFSTESPLNPKFFAYGSFPIYLLRWLSAFAPPVSMNVPWREDLVAMALLGRALSALFDLGTIAMTFLLARRLYDATVGLDGIGVFGGHGSAYSTRAFLHGRYAPGVLCRRDDVLVRTLRGIECASRCAWHRRLFRASAGDQDYCRAAHCADSCRGSSCKQMDGESRERAQKNICFCAFCMIIRG